MTAERNAASIAQGIEELVEITAGFDRAFTSTPTRSPDRTHWRTSPGATPKQKTSDEPSSSCTECALPSCHGVSLNPRDPARAHQPTCIGAACARDEVVVGASLAGRPASDPSI